MKILTNKNYRGLVDKIEWLEEELKKRKKDVSDLESYNYELLEDKDKYYKLYKEQIAINKDHLKFNGELRKERDLKIQQHNEYIKRKNKEMRELRKLISSLSEELENEKALRRGEYTKKVLKPDKTRAKQEMGVKKVVCKSTQEQNRLKELN